MFKRKLFNNEKEIEKKCPNCGSENLTATGHNSNGLSGIEWYKYKCRKCNCVFVVDYGQNKVVVEKKGKTQAGDE